jgi:hypothetical protein
LGNLREAKAFFCLSFFNVTVVYFKMNKILRRRIRLLLCYTHVPTHTNSIPKLLIVVALHKITSHSRRIAALLEEKLKKK